VARDRSARRPAGPSARLGFGASVTGVVALLALLAFRTPASPHAPQQTPAPDAQGRLVYQKWCAGCHGDSGRGDGYAATRLWPRPRDFTRALYQVRTTATGELPRDEDIRHVVDEGMPGTSMPAWKATLSSDERAAVVRYVKSFGNFQGNPPTAITMGSKPGGGSAAVDSGRALYRKIECWKCHGNAGRGDGPSAARLKDDFNNPIRAADLTANWRFNGGGTVEDIYRRLRTGLDGTPMPSFNDLIDGHIVSDADLWRVAMYVRSLSPEETPRVRDVVRADRAAALPGGPDDSAWTRVERFYLPLVGQVIERPRNFAPAVSGVFVQAVHDGAHLAIRVSWSDQSKSPDTTWTTWRGRMARTMADDSVPFDTLSPFPDRLVIQFPVSAPSGMERPYFLMGNADHPVYLWDWSSTTGGAAEAVAHGLGRQEPIGAQPDSVTAVAAWHDGAWSVQFVRALVTADSTNRLQFAPGRAIPMSVYAWDGSNNEDGTRAAIGSWNAIYLAEPVRAGVYVWPVVAALLAFGLLLLAIRQAQRAAAQAAPRAASEPQGMEAV